MDFGQVELSELRSLISTTAQPAWIRAVGGAGDDGAVAPLWHAEVVVGPVDAGEERVWRYEECTFASAMISAGALAAILEAGATQTLAVGGAVFSFDLNTHVNYQRKPCFGQFDEPPLIWPSVAYTGSVVQPQSQFRPPSGFLVGEGAPAFASFGVAFQAFFTGNYAYSGSRNPSLGSVLVRVCDLRGRIMGVNILPTSLEVSVDGTLVEGARVELMAVRDRGQVQAVRGEPVTLLLPQGLPEDAWLWLRTDNEWLDYRSLGSSLGSRYEDVVDERPAETALDLAALIAGGEGQHLEFKSRLPENNPPARRAALKTIVAFANGDGGTMFYGVDDTGHVVGLDNADDRTRDQFNDILRSWTSPMPRCRAQLESLEGKVVLAVHVEAGGGTIHALTVEVDRPEYYVRRGATSFHARADELQAIAASRQKNAGGLRSLLG